MPGGSYGCWLLDYWLSIEHSANLDNTHNYVMLYTILILGPIRFDTIEKIFIFTQKSNYMIRISNGINVT
jgi:hypothetical protein